MTGSEGERAETGSTDDGAPRWVKSLGLLAAVAIGLALLIALLTGGLGEHGPGRHLPDSSGSAAGPLVPQATATSGHR